MLMVGGKYHAFKILKEIFDEQCIYLRSECDGKIIYDRVKVSDLKLDEDDEIVIDNAMKVERKVK